MPTPLHPSRPTVYQIGAVAHAPDLRHAFETWSQATGLGDNERPQLVRLDTHPKQGWPTIVATMADNPAIWGAVVFEAKAEILAHGADVFAAIGPDARTTGEINVISAGPRGLVADNTGVRAAAQSLDRLLRPGHWRQHPEAQLIILGAGSRAAALALAACRRPAPARPARIVVSDHDRHALDRIERMIGAAGSSCGPVETQAAGPGRNPAQGLYRVPQGSVIAHAPRPRPTAIKPPFAPGLDCMAGCTVWDLDLDPQSPCLRWAKQIAADRRLRIVTGLRHYRASLELILETVFHMEARPDKLVSNAT